MAAVKAGDKPNIFMIDDDSDVMDDQVQNSQDSDSDGEMSENSDAGSVASSIKEGLPGTLKGIFDHKDVTLAQSRKNKNASLFTKTKAPQIGTDSIEDMKRR